MRGLQAPGAKRDLAPLAGSKLFVGFVLASGFAALVNIATRVVFNRWIPFSAAIVAAYACGMLTAFVLNKLFVFTDAINPFHRQAFWFAVVNVVALAETLAVSLLLARWLFPMAGFHYHAETVAHVIGVAAPVVTSFIGHKRFTFSSK